MQASHACIESAKQIQSDCQPYLVVIGVRSERKLNEILQKTQEFCDVYPFREPDMNGQLTAFATKPLDDSYKERFRKYQLLQ